MDRRNFLRALGIGAVAGAVAPRIAVVEASPPLVAASAIALHTHDFSSAANRAHTHQICVCGSPHHHGCASHQSGIYQMPQSY